MIYIISFSFMYYYPLLLLTADDVRNNSIADMFEDEMNESTTYKRSFYGILPEIVKSGEKNEQKLKTGQQENDLFNAVLYDILEIDKIMTMVLLEIFRSNMNVLSTTLPDMDVWRIRDKVRKVLTLIRKRCQDIIHPFDDYVFADKCRKLNLWEENDNLTDKKSDNVQNWNNIVLNRISDIHHHMHILTSILEPRILIYDKSIQEGTSFSVSEDYQIIDRIPVILDTCRAVHKEVKEYTRFIDSL